MKKIMLAYDGSEDSKKALAVLLELCECTGAELYSVYVIPPEEKMLAAHEMLANMDMEDVSKKVFDEVVELGKLKGLHIKTVVKRGDEPQGIIEAAKEYNCDLIVVGHIGLGKLERFILGSVAESVAKRSKTSVLIVR